MTGGPVSIHCENSRNATIIVGDGNRVDGRAVRSGPRIVRAAGERWAEVRVKLEIRRRVEEWARKRRCSFSDALLRLAEKGLDAEKRTPRRDP